MNPRVSGNIGGGEFPAVQFSEDQKSFGGNDATGRFENGFQVQFRQNPFG